MTTTTTTDEGITWEEPPRRSDEGITWEEPPHLGSRSDTAERTGKYVTLLAPLVERPGDWARIVTYDKARTAYAKAGAFKSGKFPLPPIVSGEWEFIARTVNRSTREYAVFARYVRTNQAHYGVEP